MIRLTRLLTEVLAENLPFDIMQHKIRNPHFTGSGRHREEITVGYALKFPQSDPAHQAARSYLMRFAKELPADEKPAGKSAGKDTDGPDSRSPEDSDTAPTPPSDWSYELTPEEEKALGQFPVKMGYMGDYDLSDYFARQELQGELEEFFGTLEDGSRIDANILSRVILGAVGVVAQDPTDVSEVELHIGDHGHESQGNIDMDLGGAVEIRVQAGANVYSFGLYGLNEEVGSYMSAEYLVAGERRQGMAKRMMQNILEMSDKLDITHSVIEADLEVGGYVWAKVGGIPGVPVDFNDGEFEEEDAREFFPHYGKAMDRYEWTVDQTENRLDRVHEVLENVREGVDEDRILETMGAPYRNDNSFIINTDVSRGMNEHLLLELKKLEATGNANTVIEVLERAVSHFSHDPTMITVIANSPIGRYMLQGARWMGYFDLEKGSEGREIIEAYANQ